VVASACAGLSAPIDGVTTALDAPAVLAKDLAHARELGFGGKLCIHPRQVEQVNRSFSPTEGELAWAAKVLAASASADGVHVVDGKMIDPPVVRRAQRLVARALH
jgi:citrate lyase subunit beta/citryl-CoA lyase